jgi:hypothetical protein
MSTTVLFGSHIEITKPLIEWVLIFARPRPPRRKENVKSAIAVQGYIDLEPLRD